MKGIFGVVLNEQHFRELLWEHMIPPALSMTTSSSALVLMGFPTQMKANSAYVCDWYFSFLFFFLNYYYYLLIFFKNLFDLNKNKTKKENL